MTKPPPPIITKLEKELKQSLTQLSHPHSWAKAKSYALDGNDNVIALNLRGTGIPDFTLTPELQYLKKLDLSRNNLTALHFETQLPQLELLDLSYNQTDWAELTLPAGFERLQYLYVYESKLKSLVLEGAMPMLDILNVKENPLSNPPTEIVKKGKEAILRYFEQIEEQGGTETINEAKLIIVGEGKSGKTTLFKKLINPKYVIEPLTETHGINIYEGLELKDSFRANLWDFGGQELQYMTHQFFLTPRALYLLMMDARKGSPNLSYWFKIISLLGKHSPNEKVQLLIVLNKHEDDTTGNPMYQDILKYYEQDFNYQFLEVNLGKNDKRWENLKESIDNQLFNLPIVKSLLPKKWKPIREALREEAKTRPYISTDRLAEICSRYQVTDDKQQWQMTDYLHQLGSVLHFQNDLELMELVVLSPEWVVEGVYTFLSDIIKNDKKGKFSDTDIFHILHSKGYSKTDAHRILKLMSKNNFDICYKSESGNYVAAELLPENTPPQYQWHTHTGALQFRYQYTIMPKGLMSRLIVRLSEYIEVLDGVEIVWKKGAILRLKMDGSVCRILIKEDDAESKTSLKQIIIEVMEDNLPYRNRKFALRRVRQEVESLHEKWFKNIDVEEIIPCNCDTCKTLLNPFTYELSKLVKLKKGVDYCNISEEFVSLNQLLEGVYEQSEISTSRRIPLFRDIDGEHRMKEGQEFLREAKILDPVLPFQQTIIINPSQNPPLMEQNQKPANDPIAIYSFLSAAVILGGILLVALTNLDIWKSLLFIAGLVLLITLVAFLQLKNDDRIKEETFVNVLTQILKKIPPLSWFGQSK